MSDTQHGLSQQQVAHSLRHFNLMGASWAIYGPNATVAGVVFTGLCLKVGLRDANIAILVALMGFMGITQAFSYFLTRHFADKRRATVILGFFEITLVSLSVAAGILLPPALRFYGIAAALICGMLFAHAVSPMFSSWMSNVIPANIRASYIGNRLLMITAIAMVYLFLASRFLDLVAFPENFIIVFIVGWLGGLGGYFFVVLTPYPNIREVKEEHRSPLKSLLLPLRDRTFRLLCIYGITSTTAGMIAAPFFSIYQLRNLELSYSTVALFTNISLATMILGYWMVGSLSQKFGNKPIVQLLILPWTLLHLLWAFTTKENYWVTIPIASAIGGFVGAGFNVAISTLLYKSIPQGREVPEYFVIWTVCATIGATVGPLASGLLKNALGATQFTVMGVELTGIQIIFAIAALATVPNLLLAFRLRESGTTPPMSILGQFRGNLVSLAYNFALYASTKEDEKRADTLRALGRTHSPLAVGRLLKGLKDTSPAVRTGAVEGLGESRLEEGLDALVLALEDEETDVRPVAAEALGKLGKPEGVEPLLRALHDEDARLRNSAALALGEIGGAEAREAVYRALTEQFDRQTFAPFVDAASRMGDLRVIEPAFANLPHLQSPVVRMQVLNAVGRVLRERSHFYRLRVTDALGRAGLVGKMLARVVKLLKTQRHGIPEQRERLVRLGQEIAGAAAADDHAGMREACRKYAHLVLTMEGVPPVAQAAVHSIILYLHDTEQGGSEEEALVFLTIALTSASRHLAMPGN